MSRIGKKEIIIPEGVKAEITNQKVKIDGQKGSFQITLNPKVLVEMTDGRIIVKPQHPDKLSYSLQGTTRQLLANAVTGVTNGWSKTLEVVGTGYRAGLEGGRLVLSLGYSHQINVEPADGINFTVSENKITVSGIDRDLVGRTADKIRRLRVPDSYKGKGIRYMGERVKLKPGKQAKAATTGGK